MVELAMISLASSPNLAEEISSSRVMTIRTRNEERPESLLRSLFVPLAPALSMMSDTGIKR